MDSFEINKILGALLGTALLVMGINTLATELFRPHAPEVAGFEVEVAEEEAPDETPAEEEAVVPLAVRMADADIGKGETAFKKCAACHTVDNGGGNKVGPNLWNIVTRPKGAMDGFNYSSAMEEVAAAGQVWGYEELYKFLENPRDYMKGTSMGFAGLRKPDERINILAYLRSLSDNPAPLPEVPAEAAPADTAPAEAAPAEAAPAEAAPAPEGSTQD